MNGSDEMVSVMVPRRLVTQVYGLISRLDAGLSVEDVTPAPTAPASNGDSASDWTDMLLRRMVEESPPAMRDILGLLASRPGESLGAEDLAKSIKANKEANWNTIAGTLGAFGRRVKSRYKSDQWPFTAKYEHAHDGVRYRMTAQMATRIKKLLAETE
ncbi:MAG: hypothetical protein ACKVS8_03635 [Phycisphaerales bacterium]